MGDPDTPGQQSVHVDQPEPGAEMGWDGGGRKQGRSVSLEGERRQQAHAVELDPGPQPNAGRLHRRVDLTAKRRARGREQQLEALEVADLDPLGPRQGVVVDGDHEHDVLFEERFGDEVAPGDGKGEHGQVQAPRRQLGLEAQGGAVRHDQVQAGVGQRQVGEQRRHEPAGRGAEDPDPYVPRHRLSQRPDVGDQRVELPDDPVGPGHHHLPVGGQSPC